VIFAGQKTFNGVAILSKTPAIEILFDIPHFEDHQRRIIAATIDGIRVINVYVPNGSEVGSEKYQYKLHWLTHLTQFLKQELTAHEKVIVLGDFNVAPEDQDVHDPKAWEGSVLVSEKERQALRKIMDLGFADLFRQFTQPPQSFSWWDYRNGGYWKGEGLRIDLVLANQALAAQCRACMIDVRPRKLKSPSDHAPVIAEFAKFA
jgi:exodeoxyribonuclease-3